MALAKTDGHLQRWPVTGCSYQLLSKQSKIAGVDDDHALTVEKDRSLGFVNSKEIEEPQIFGIHAFILSRSIATKVAGGIHPGFVISKPHEDSRTCRAANPNRNRLSSSSS